MNNANKFSRRPRPNVGGIPPEVHAWFEGTGPWGWFCLLPNFEPTLYQQWQKYKQFHPDAVPPKGGYEWLDAPEPPPDPFNTLVTGPLGAKRR
jgi:hypothetical protein